MPIYTTTIHTADDAIVNAWWPRIGDESFVRSARVTRIRDPLIRHALVKGVQLPAVPQPRDYPPPLPPPPHDG
ncbi:hypothetical protein R6Q57_024479 [Mikania cordata]